VALFAVLSAGVSAASRLSGGGSSGTTTARRIAGVRANLDAALARGDISMVRIIAAGGTSPLPPDWTAPINWSKWGEEGSFGRQYATQLLSSYDARTARQQNPSAAPASGAASAPSSPPPAPGTPAAVMQAAASSPWGWVAAGLAVLALLVFLAFRGR